MPVEKLLKTLGGDGSGYNIAKTLGHTIVSTVPALVGLKCSEKIFKCLGGVRAGYGCFYILAEIPDPEPGEVS